MNAWTWASTVVHRAPELGVSTVTPRLHTGAAQGSGSGEVVEVDEVDEVDEEVVELGSGSPELVEVVVASVFPPACAASSSTASETADVPPRMCPSLRVAA